MGGEGGDAALLPPSCTLSLGFTVTSSGVNGFGGSAVGMVGLLVARVFYLCSVGVGIKCLEFPDY